MNQSISDETGDSEALEKQLLEISDPVPEDVLGRLPGLMNHPAAGVREQVARLAGLGPSGSACEFVALYLTSDRDHNVVETAVFAVRRFTSSGS